MEAGEEGGHAPPQQTTPLAAQHDDPSGAPHRDEGDMAAATSQPPPAEQQRRRQEPEQQDRQQPQRKKHSNIPVACGACQKRKSRCDGERPKCGVCRRKCTECRYEAAANETRARTLKRRIEELSGKLERQRCVLDYLRHGSEHEVAAVVSRVRGAAGDDGVDRAVALISQSSLLLATTAGGAASGGGGGGDVKNVGPSAVDTAGLVAGVLQAMRLFPAERARHLLKLALDGTPPEELRSAIDDSLTALHEQHVKEGNHDACAELEGRLGRLLHDLRDPGTPLER